MKKYFLLFITICFICLSANAQEVVFNQKTLKYHHPSCQWAKNVQKTVLLLIKRRQKQRAEFLVKYAAAVN